MVVLENDHGKQDFRMSSPDHDDLPQTAFGARQN